MAHTMSDMSNMSRSSMSLQEQIMLQEQEIEIRELSLNRERELLSKMKEPLERSPAPFSKWFRDYKDPKGRDHHGMWEYYKVGWNAAMKCVGLQAGYNPELITFINSAIEP